MKVESANDYAIVVFVQIPEFELWKLKKILGFDPHRIDRVDGDLSQVNCVYLIDGFNETLTEFEQCLTEIGRFLGRYGDGLKQIQKEVAELSITIDIGHFLMPGLAMKSYRMPRSFLELLSNNSISLDLSVYNTEEDAT
jgi:hypothetical protein